MAANTQTNIIFAAIDKGASAIMSKLGTEADSFIDKFSKLGDVMKKALGGKSFTQLVGMSMDFIDKMKSDTTGLAVLLTDTVRGSSDEISKAFDRNLLHARSFFGELRRQSAVSISSFQDLTEAYKLFAARGLSLQLEDADKFARLVDRLKLTGGSQGSVYQQLNQVISGSALRGTVLAKTFASRDANFQETIRNLVGKGNGTDVVNYLASLFSDTGEKVASEISSRLSAQKNRVKTEVHLWAAEAFMPLYDTVTGIFKDIADSISGRTNPIMKGMEDLARKLDSMLKAVYSIGSAFVRVSSSAWLGSMVPKLVAIASAAAAAAKSFGVLKGAILSVIAARGTVQGKLAMASVAALATAEWSKTGTAPAYRQGEKEDYINELKWGFRIFFEMVKEYGTRILQVVGDTLTMIVKMLSAAWDNVAGFIGNAVHDVQGVIDAVGRSLGIKSLQFDKFNTSPFTSEERSVLDRYVQLMKTRGSSSASTVPVSPIPDDRGLYESMGLSGMYDAMSVTRTNAVEQDAYQAMKGAAEFILQSRGVKLDEYISKYQNNKDVNYNWNPYEMMNGKFSGGWSEGIDSLSRTLSGFSESMDRVWDNIEKDMTRNAAKSSLKDVPAYTMSFEQTPDYAEAKKSAVRYDKELSFLFRDLSRFNEAFSGLDARANDLESAMEQAASKFKSSDDAPESYKEYLSIRQRINELEESLSTALEQSKPEIVKNISDAYIELGKITSFAVKDLTDAVNTAREKAIGATRAKLAAEIADAREGKTVSSLDTASQASWGSSYRSELETVRNTLARLTRDEQEGMESLEAATRRAAEAEEKRKEALGEETRYLREQADYLGRQAALESSGSPFAGISAQMNELAHTAQSNFAMMKDFAASAASSMQSSLSDGFFKVFKGELSSLGDVFSSFCDSLLKAWTDMLAQMAMKSIMQSAMGQSISNWFGGLFGGTVVAAANGGVLDGGFRAFASGGVVNSPTLGLVGEGRYNEAVVPLPDGRSIPVVQRGGGVVVNVIDNSGSDTSKSVRESRDSEGNAVLDIVIEAMASNRRNFRQYMKTQMA